MLISLKGEIDSKKTGKTRCPHGFVPPKAGPGFSRLRILIVLESTAHGDRPRHITGSKKQETALICAGANRNAPKRDCSGSFCPVQERKGPQNPCFSDKLIAATSIRKKGQKSDSRMWVPHIVAESWAITLGLSKWTNERHYPNQYSKKTSALQKIR